MKVAIWNQSEGIAWLIDQIRPMTCVTRKETCMPNRSIVHPTRGLAKKLREEKGKNPSWVLRSKSKINVPGR
jgi:hypothetical protein